MKNLVVFTEESSARELLNLLLPRLLPEEVSFVASRLKANKIWKNNCLLS